MTRFNELLEKRKNLTSNIFEEEELIESSKKMSVEEVSEIDPELLTYSHHKRHNDIMDMLNKLGNLLDKKS